MVPSAGFGEQSASFIAIPFKNQLVLGKSILSQRKIFLEEISAEEVELQLPKSSRSLGSHYQQWNLEKFFPMEVDYVISFEVGHLFQSPFCLGDEKVYVRIFLGFYIVVSRGFLAFY